MKHLTDIGALSDQDVEGLLASALTYSQALAARDELGAPLQGRLQFNLFYENSTRTSLSFVVAAQRMGVQVVNVPVAASSVHKGESLRDTVLTLAAQGADFLVLRATEAGTIQSCVDAFGEMEFSTGVINGGEGAFGHPTQALLDAAALLAATKRAAYDGLHGLKIAIVGDLKHSRVAASCTELFLRLGAEVRLCAPKALQPAWETTDQASVTSDLGEALDDADVAMTLRIQKERFDAAGAIDLAGYKAAYALTYEALKAAKPGAFVMHPGPMNRGVEIDPALADDPARSLILRQVAMGVPLRMAVLAFSAEL